MISAWTNTEELQVLESLDHPIKARGYLAKWDNRKREGCRMTVNVRDGEPRRVYYSIRVEIEAGEHVIRSYGEGVDQTQSYYANQKNALKAMQGIFDDFGIPYNMLQEGSRLGVSWRDRFRETAKDLSGL